MTAVIRRGRPVVPDAGEFTYGLLGVATLYGVLCLANAERAATTVRMLPWSWAVQAFGATLLLGAVLALFGRLVLTDRAVFIEAAGLMILAGQGIAFLTWTLAYVGLRALGLTLFMGAMLTGPSIWRVVRIYRALRRVDGARPGEVP